MNYYLSTIMCQAFNLQVQMPGVDFKITLKLPSCNLNSYKCGQGFIRRELRMQAWGLQTGIFLWLPCVRPMISSEHACPSFPDWMVDSSWGLLDKGILPKSTLHLVSRKLQWNADWKIK